MSANRNIYQYQINTQNEIISVNEAWDAFATYNDGAHLRRSEIIGKPLLDAIPVDHVRTLYQRLLDAVRYSRHAAQIPFRCDAPEERRFMVLDISPEPDGSLCLSGNMLKVEYRSPVALLDQKLKRNDKTVTVCSICLHMSSGGAWQEIEDALDDAMDARPEHLPQVAWCICPECVEHFEQQISHCLAHKPAESGNC